MFICHVCVYLLVLEKTTAGVKFLVCVAYLAIKPDSDSDSDSDDP